MNLLVNYGIMSAQKPVPQLVPIASQIYTYTGAAQTVTLNPGIYTFEAWGASARDNTGDPLYGGLARGAYTKGDIEITEPTTFYLYVGEGAFNGIRTTNPNDPNAYGFNGGAVGGHFSASWSRGYDSGGGATDIRLTGGAWNDTIGLRSRIMVAGGAGPGKNGGTLTGLAGWAEPRGGAGGPGTQTSGGAAGGSGAGAGIFGRGGIGYISNPGCPNCNSANGSGSGYYGGGGGWGGTCGCSPRASGSGGSGSSFISGHTGCNAVNSSGSHTGQPNHYSGLVFTNTVMTEGLGDKHSFVETTSGRNPAATGHGKILISGSEWSTTGQTSGNYTWSIQPTGYYNITTGGTWTPTPTQPVHETTTLIEIVPNSKIRIDNFNIRPYHTINLFNSSQQWIGAYTTTGTPSSWADSANGTFASASDIPNLDLLGASYFAVFHYNDGIPDLGDLIITWEY